MARFKWKPGHPMADDSGWVKEEDFYSYPSMEEDKRYMDGNKVVDVQYIPDEMPPTRHMINSKYYTSKKKFRDETRARGCIEIGNETAHMLKPRKPIELDRAQRRNDIRRAIWEIRNGRRIFQE